MLTRHQIGPADRMTVNPVPKLLLFFATYYFAQGVYNAFGSFEQPWLRSRGLSLSDISASKSVAIIPWSVKLLFAIPCDMVGRRLPFATAGMIIGASLLITLTAFDPGESPAAYSGYVGTVFARNFGIAISDVAVDGMSVDSGLEHMSGTVQGVMSAGRVIGTLLGSAIGAPIAAQSYSGVIIFLGVVILLLVPVTFMVKEEKVGKSDEFEWAAFRELGRTPVLLFLLYAMIGNLSGSIAGVPSTEWAQTVVGLSAEDFGYLSVVGSVGDLVGALGMGFLFDRIEKRIGMLLTAVLSCVTSIVALWCTSREAWFGLAFVSGIASGALFVVDCSMVMRLADKRLGASVFAIAVSLMNFSSMIGNAAAGPLAESTDLKTAFWVSFAINMLQIPLVPFIVVEDHAHGSHKSGADAEARESLNANAVLKTASSKKLIAGDSDADPESVIIKNVYHAAAAFSSSSSSSPENPSASASAIGGGGGADRDGRVLDVVTSPSAADDTPTPTATTSLIHHSTAAAEDPTAHIADFSQRKGAAKAPPSHPLPPGAAGNPFAALAARGATAASIPVPAVPSAPHHHDHLPPGAPGNPFGASSPSSSSSVSTSAASAVVHRKAGMSAGNPFAVTGESASAGSGGGGGGVGGDEAPTVSARTARVTAALRQSSAGTAGREEGDGALAGTEGDADGAAGEVEGGRGDGEGTGSGSGHLHDQ